MRYLLLRAQRRLNQDVAIVGSGPSAMYTAKYILRKSPRVFVDIFDRLPIPYGLVRFGVAPDHPEVLYLQS